MPAHQSKDGGGVHWTVPAELKLDRSGVAMPEVTGWWQRQTAKVAGRNVTVEAFAIRQENPGVGKADVIVISLGQVYDMIDMLNKAVLEL